jgi:hypothetical protein
MNNVLLLAVLAVLFVLFIKRETYEQRERAANVIFAA